MTDALKKIWFSAAVLTLSVTFGLFLFACSPEENGSKEYRVAYMDPDTGVQSYRILTLKTLNTSNSLDGSIFHVTINGELQNGGMRGIQRLRLTRLGNVWKPLDVASEQALALQGHLEDIYFRELGWGIAGLLKYPRAIGVDFRVSTRVQDREDYLNNAMFIVSMGAVVHYHADQDEHTSTSMDLCVNAHEHFHDLFQTHFVEPWRTEFQRLQPRLDLREGTLVKKFMNSTPMENLGYIYGLIASWNEGLADLWCYAHTGQTRIGKFSMPSITSHRDIVPLSNDSLNLISPEDSRLDFQGRRHGCKKRMCEKYYQGTNLARVLYELSEVTRRQGAFRETFALKIVKNLSKIAVALAREMSELMDNNPQTLLSIGHRNFLLHLFDGDLSLDRQTCSVVARAVRSQDLFEEKLGGKCR